MRLRIGAWIVVGSLMASVLSFAVLVGIQRIYLTLGDGLRESPISTLCGFADLASQTGVAVGLVVCTLGTAGVSRRWFGIAALCTALPVVARLAAYFDVTSPWMPHAISIATPLAMFAFGFAAKTANPAVRRMSWVLLLCGGFSLLTEIVRHDIHPTLEFGWAAFLLQLPWCFAGLTLLGAFPELGPVPVAQIRSWTRPIATAASFALCIVGIVLVSLAVWATVRVGTNDVSSELAGGTSFSLAGALALWRLRAKPLSIALGFAIAFTLNYAGRVGVSFMTLDLTEVRLETYAAPGLEISLPEGTRTTRYRFFEMGWTAVRPRHSELTSVDLIWDNGSEDPNADRAGSGDYVTHRTIGDVPVTLVTHETGSRADSFVTWRCEPDDRWFTLVISADAKDSPRGAFGLSKIAPSSVKELQQLVLDHVLPSIRCKPETRDAAAPITLAFTPPPGFRVRANDPFTYEAPDEEAVIALRWGANRDYVAAMRADPVALLRRLNDIEPEQATGTVVRLAPLWGVDGSEREVTEIPSGDERYLIAAVSCRYGFEVLATSIGPATAPREPILAALQTASCPRF